MFRFSIRELMLVTLVVGLGFGWLLDHRQQDVQIESGNAWRLRAGTVEDILGAEKLKIEWGEDYVIVKDPSGSAAFSPINFGEPSPVSR